ncbi:MAG: hypothetical protein CV087_16775 [Candidatus Brocadia sp. WS118]|nr:MAG: hypothetical protein CV087_16775 [Candidatus Brocadia sp. WS118]
MNEDEAYLDVAQRYIESCQQHLTNGINIQEVLGFKSYHAFESIGGAYNSHYGHRVPRSHAMKLNMFVANSRRDHQVNGRAVAILAMTLNSMRNKYLYPERNGRTFTCPKDQISITNARDLIRRVNGIIRQISRII